MYLIITYRKQHVILRAWTWQAGAYAVDGVGIWPTLSNNYRCRRLERLFVPDCQALVSTSRACPMHGLGCEVEALWYTLASAISIK